MLIHKLPFQKRMYAKKGVNIIEEINKAFERPDIGLSSIVSGGAMYGLFFFFCFGVLNFGMRFLNFYLESYQIKLNLQAYHFIVLVILSIVVNHFLLFKNDKYLVYFKEFKKMLKKDKTKWAWISFLLILGIFLFSAGSLVFLHSKF